MGVHDSFLHSLLPSSGDYEKLRKTHHMHCTSVQNGICYTVELTVTVEAGKQVEVFITLIMGLLLATWQSVLIKFHFKFSISYQRVKKQKYSSEGYFQFKCWFDNDWGNCLPHRSQSVIGVQFRLISGKCRGQRGGTSWYQLQPGWCRFSWVDLNLFHLYGWQLVWEKSGVGSRRQVLCLRVPAHAVNSRRQYITSQIQYETGM